jgi:hypothetical protein
MRHGRGGGRSSRNPATNISSMPETSGKATAASLPTHIDPENPYLALEDMYVDAESEDTNQPQVTGNDNSGVKGIEEYSTNTTMRKTSTNVDAESEDTSKTPTTGNAKIGGDSI